MPGALEFIMMFFHPFLVGKSDFVLELNGIMVVENGPLNAVFVILILGAAARHFLNISFLFKRTLDVTLKFI